MTPEERAVKAIDGDLRRCTNGEPHDLVAAVAAEIRAAVADERETCANLAESPYSDAVGAFGGRVSGDEPLAVGHKIAAAIRARK